MPLTIMDARGMKCPRPIIELAKMRRRTQGPTIVEIQADDLAFESDVRAWCECTRNELLSVDSSGDGVIARIVFQSTQEQTP